MKYHITGIHDDCPNCIVVQDAIAIGDGCLAVDAIRALSRSSRLIPPGTEIEIIEPDVVICREVANGTLYLSSSTEAGPKWTPVLADAKLAEAMTQWLPKTDGVSIATRLALIGDYDNA